jgi:plasmid maintenance system antidote protein VapI
MKSLRNPNRKPTHPGAVLREDVLPELGWSEGELAIRLMVSKQTVCDLLREEL